MIRWEDIAHTGSFIFVLDYDFHETSSWGSHGNREHPGHLQILLPIRQPLTRVEHRLYPECLQDVRRLFQHLDVG